MTRGAFVVIDGLTGSGKSTVARRIAATTSMHYVEPIQEAFDPARRMLDESMHDIDARHLFFLAAVATSARRVEGLLAAGMDVIVDSWSTRTHVTHRVLGSTLDVADPQWFPEPDLVVWLEVPESERKRRIRSRGRPSSPVKAALEPLSTEIRSGCLVRHPSTQVVDATKPVDELAAQLTVLISGANP